MKNRILTAGEERQLSRKPATLSESDRIELPWDRCADLLSGPVVIEAVVVSAASLHAVAAKTDADQFVVVDRAAGAWWIVNTEGYDYARYFAQVRGC